MLVVNGNGLFEPKAVRFLAHGSSRIPFESPSPQTKPDCSQARAASAATLLQRRFPSVFGYSPTDFFPYSTADRTEGTLIPSIPRHLLPPASFPRSAKSNQVDCAWFFLPPRRTSISPPPRDCRQSALPERPSRGTPRAGCSAENPREREC